MDESNAIEFREYAAGDEAGIFELMNQHWTYMKGKNALRDWRWLYRQGPLGDAIIVVSVHGPKIVGHYAMLPLRMYVGGREIPAGKAEGSAVHEDYRGNIADRFFPEKKEFRIFGRLIADLFQLAESRGIALIWAFPNSAAVKGQIRAGYDHFIFPINRMVLPLRLREMRRVHPIFVRFKGYASPIKYPVTAYLRVRSGRRSKRRVPRVHPSVQVRDLDPIKDRDKIDRFFGEFISENKLVTIKRNVDYLEWRFLRNPVFEHRILVTESEGKITSMVAFNLKTMSDGSIAGNIVDLLALRDRMDHFRLCLGSCVQELEQAGAICVDTWVNDNDVFDRIRPYLRRQGFVSLPRYFDRQGLNMIYKVFDASIDREVLKDPRNWYITMAFTEGTS